MPDYVLGMIIVVALLTAFIIFVLSRRLYTRRLKAIRTMIADMAQGNFTGRLNVYSKDELSDIARSLNEVASEFQKRIRKITDDKDQLEAILSSMVEGVIVVESNGRLQHVSPNFCQMLELRSKDTQDKLYWEVIRNQEISDSIKDALTNKKAIKKEVHILGAQENFFSMQISPVLDPQGRLISLAAVFHDITELKKLEKMRSEFVANVSHELKTPLTAIKGFVETLRTTAKEDPKAAEKFLEIIAKQTERLEILVNDLLILSSIESQEVKMDIGEEPLQKILQSVLQVCKTQIDAHHQDIQLILPSEPLLILADRQRIEQVFLNLLDNAIKFTPDKGKIIIEAQKQANFIRIDFSDNGIGIAPQHLSRLFERFYRVDKARSRDTGGTGLGLAIVKHIVYAHQGKLSVTSTPGQGTTFSVYLLYPNPS